MIDAPLENLESWITYLEELSLPILRQSAVAFAQMARHEENVSARDLAQVILHDPFLTIRVLRHLQSQHGQRERAEITTISHAIMILGVARVLSTFRQLTVLEDQLKKTPDALFGVMRVMSRAHHAALYAEDWSTARHDIESDEVIVAALLHDMGEMLLWTFAPMLAERIRLLQAQNLGLRSRDAQQMVLGFPLMDLQVCLGERWGLPALLRLLMDDDHSEVARVRTVVLATALARHTALGWYDPALPDDYRQIQYFLGLSDAALEQHIRRPTLLAARDWHWYQIPPAAAWWPLEPTP